MSQPVVLITGCRSGFGLHAAVHAARVGFVVFAGLRDVSTADGLVEAAAGLPVQPVQLDVTDPAQRDAVVADILAQHGRIDGLVNNAGRGLGGFHEQVDEDEMRALFDVNVFGLFALTNAVLPAMRAQGSGVVVNVSSVAGRIANPGMGIYASSKFAVEGMSEALALEVAPFGVQVVLIEPGPYKTDIFTRNMGTSRRSNTADSPYQARAEHMLGLVERAMRTAGDPEEVAARIVHALQGRISGLRVPMGPGTRLRLTLKGLLPWPVYRALINRVTSP